MRFAEMAAPFFPTAEIIELHHDGKVDAPSGTAMRNNGTDDGSVRRVGRRPDTRGSATRSARATGPSGINVHSVRLRGLVAHQEVSIRN